MGQIITIDTRDQDSCFDIQYALNIADLCMIKEKAPYVSVTIFNYQKVDPNVLKNLNANNSKLVKSVRNASVMGLFGLGIIFAQPASKTHWDKSGDYRKKWQENSSGAPVFDKDPFITNFVEHPLSGAAYYSVARHNGMSVWGSFAFSVAMSTFMWEYGLEAFFEKPSIQDLIVTPVLGSLLGEFFYQIKQSIENNNGEVFGSKTLGTIINVITNPGYYFSNAIDSLLGDKNVTEGQLRWDQVVDCDTFRRAEGSCQGGQAIMLSLRIKF